MKIFKAKSVEELLGADLTGVTEIQAMNMCLDDLPQDFFLGANNLEILYLKSSWRQDGLPAIPATVRQLFCCNLGPRGGGSSRGGGYTPSPPKPERKPFIPELPPPAPEDPSQPARIDNHNGKTYNWDPESQKWEIVMINIDLLPAGLVKFYASEVRLSGALDFSRFTKMEELILNQCEIEKIVAWPPHVRLIYANWNKLESVPEFPASVQIVELNDNQLSALPAIAHTQLQLLRVDKNKLVSIPQMPETMGELRAENNQLVSLPKVIPTGMQRLYVRCDKLASLPAMAHSQLEELFCGFNKLSALPQLPVTLEQLYCHDNRLRSLVLHEGLQELYCGYNLLTEHPHLPETCTEFNGVGNNGFDELEQYMAGVHMLRYQMNNGLVRAQA